MGFGAVACTGGDEVQGVNGAGGTGASGGSTGISGARSIQPDGGNGSGGSRASDAGGDPGSAGSGGADGSAGSGSGGQPDAGPDDPKPVAPDSTGLIPTSSQWVLFTETTGSLFTSNLTLLDLASGTRHETNGGGPQLVLGSLSPDEQTFLFSSADGSSSDSERLLRLGESGFVPARSISGYDGIPGAFRFLSWSQDSRFVVASRGAAPSDGVEIIDTRLMTRVASEDLGSIEGAFSPVGYYYYYYDPQASAFAPKYARITQDGSTGPALLPAGATNMTFDPTGKRLFYAVGGRNQRSLHFVDLPGGSSHDMGVPAAGETFDGVFFSAPGNSIVTETIASAGTTRVLRRVFVDPGKPMVDLSNPAVSEAGFRASDDRGLVVTTYSDQSFDLVRLDPVARHALPGTYVSAGANESFGVVGDHAFFPGGGSLHLATIDGTGALVEVAISDPSKTALACASSVTHEPSTKFVYLAGDGEELVFVDLNGSPPAIVGRFSRSSAALKLRCPKWGDGDRAVAIIEGGAAGSNLYLMRWIAAAPEQPVLAAQSVEQIKVYALMYH